MRLSTPPKGGVFLCLIPKISDGELKYREENKEAPFFLLGCVPFLDKFCDHVWIRLAAEGTKDQRKKRLIRCALGIYRKST